MNISIDTPKRLYQDIGIHLQNQIASGAYKIGD